MTQTVLWGSSLVGGVVRRRRVTSDYHRRVTSDGSGRAAEVTAQDVLFYRKTSASNRRVTTLGDRRMLETGQIGPPYYATGNATTDGGEPFGFLFETDPWQPDDQAAEYIFAMAYITLSWSMAATVRIRPSVDGSEDDISLWEGATAEIVAPTFQLEQQAGAMERVSRVFPVPLVRSVQRNGEEIARLNLSGERLQVTIESTGPLGVGELMLEGVEVEFTPVRRSTYPTVSTTT